MFQWRYRTVYRIGLIIWCAIGLQVPVVWSQSAVAHRYGPDSSVTSMFENGEEVLWIKHFSGMFDDAFAIDVTLAFDGVRCRGYITYTQSNTRLRLDGTLSGTTLRLEESQPVTLTPTGRWTAQFDGTQIKGEWGDKNDLLSASILLHLSDAAPPDCGNNKWVNRYVARWNDSWAELALFRANNGVLFGNLYLEAENQTFPLKGEIDDQGRYFIESPRLGGKARIELTGQMRYLQTTDCSWYAANGERRQFKFALKDNLLAGCRSWADYYSSLDVWYPRTTCTDCNTWLENKVVEWAARARTQIAALPDSITSARNQLRGSGWAQITCWNDDWLSGYMIFTNSWGSKPEGEGFIFNMTTGERIEFPGLFVRSFDYNTWLRDYARRESPKLPGFAEDPAFRTWIYEAGFPMVSLCREGLMLSTYFHPVYGQQHLIVPKRLLDGYWKKDNPVAEILK